MKNIHIIPTDKPSRLGNVHGKLSFFKDRKWDNTENWRCKNIYITSDEEIKDRDWYLTFTNNEVMGQPRKCEDTNWNFSHCKKIILSTDQDLIADGVQAIDDKFLEWFVKNPSCEWVEVIYDKDAFPYGVETAKGYGWYQIIIPQEEPKDVVLGYKTSLCAQMLDKIGLEEPKQETLEEAAENYVRNESDASLKLISKYSFKDGAKWQAEKDKQIINSLNNTLNKIGQKHIDNLFKDKPERMYSEEDMKSFGEFCADYDYRCFGKHTQEEMLKIWFEKFKKK
jgi:hypothetical protein